MQKTKIIATLGPACQDRDTITKMLSSGLSVFRINGSHLNDFQHIKKVVQQIRTIANKLDKPISIMMDLGGPKIRVQLPPNTPNITIQKGITYCLGFKKLF